MTQISPTTADPLDLSVIIPVRDEEENIPELIERLQRVITEMGLSYEIVFVTDLNRDNTYGMLRSYAEKDPHVKCVKLPNSFGQHVAIVAGMDACRGDSVVLMDGDLQDYPEDIPNLYTRMQEGFDVVYGVKEQKNDSRLRNFTTRTFLKLMDRLSDHQMEHNTCMFRIMGRRTVEALRRYREVDQNLTGLTALIGFPHAKVPVTSGKRRRGRSKYGLFRQINMAISFLLSFSTRPLRMISIFGSVVSTLSFLYLLFIIVKALFMGRSVPGWATIVSLILFLGGVQLLALGIVGEYVGRIFIESKKRPLYTIEEKIGDLQ